MRVFFGCKLYTLILGVNHRRFPEATASHTPPARRGSASCFLIRFVWRSFRSRGVTYRADTPGWPWPEPILCSLWWQQVAAAVMHKRHPHGCLLHPQATGAHLVCKVSVLRKEVEVSRVLISRSHSGLCSLNLHPNGCFCIQLCLRLSWLPAKCRPFFPMLKWCLSWPYIVCGHHQLTLLHHALAKTSVEKRAV